MRWAPHTQSGETYDLSHLHPLAFTFCLAAKNGLPQQDYSIDVIFGLHCFTRGWRAGEKRIKVECYRDDREVRRFDPERYELSKRLPAIVVDVGGRKLFHTGRGNFFTVEVLQPSGVRIEYTIYFALNRSEQKGRLTLFVQSAYSQDEVPRSKPKPRKPIKFMVLAHNVRAGLPIREPK